MRHGENIHADKILPIITVVLLLLFATSCGEKSVEKPANNKAPKSKIQKNENITGHLKEKRGNSIGNIANAGFVAQKNDWIFYCNPNDNTLNKMKSDGTYQVKIFEGNFYEINVIDDWVYCADEVGYWYYKIKSDGTKKNKLSDDECYDVNIVDNWIYYISDDGRIYKMDLDGRNRSRLNDDESCRLNVQEGWIYFCKVSAQADSEIGDSDWLPCGKIYKMKIDGTEEKLLCDNDSSFVNVNNDWIYYSNVEDELRLYKIKVDGTGKTKLSNDSCYDINVTDQYIYYSNMASLGELYRIGLDGTGKMPIGDFKGRCWDVNVTDNYLFFNYLTDKPGVDGFYRSKLDGKEKTRVK